MHVVRLVYSCKNAYSGPKYSVSKSKVAKIGSMNYSISTGPVEDRVARAQIGPPTLLSQE